MPRTERREDRLTPGTLTPEHFGLIAKALVVALVLVVAKYVVVRQGWEFIETLPLLTSLMGGVVFTLAILLSGVLTDFKESERIVGELSSQVRRLHWDLALIVKGEKLASMRAQLLALTKAINGDLRAGQAIRQREMARHLESLDAAVAEAAAAGAPSSNVRTVQVSLGNIVRIVDRLEVIIETTFIKAGYYYAGAVVLTALTALMFTDLHAALPQTLFLYGFATFLLIGVSWLVWDLDNPFSGDVKLSVRQMEKVEQYLERALLTK
jgi:hypothetical protein